MPLRDVAAFHEWIARENPSAAAQRSYGRSSPIWRSGRGERRASRLPICPARLRDAHAVLDVQDEAGIELWWAHRYASGDVDIVAVTAESPSG